MWGGILCGLYFNCVDLLEDLDVFVDVLIVVVGLGYVFNIDGIGGGVVVIIKVVMLFKFDDDWVDIDYFFV